MTILRVACYERVSTDEQALRGFSIDAQIDNLNEYCEKNNLKLVGHYTDAGISGSLSPLKRPALQQLLEDVQAGKIDMILFTKLDRWFRSVKEYFKVQEILDNHKVEWKAIHEYYDTTTANGRMAITIFLAIAQNERDKASERVKTVFSHKRKNKEACFGGPHKPFGYMKQKDADGINRLVKNPKEVNMCQDFWNILIEHDNISMAIRHMYNVYGIKKDYKTWSNIVHGQFYCGMHDGIEGFCEPYVSKSDWDKVQASIDAKKIDTRAKRTYIFSGLIRCPVCNRILVSSFTKDKKSDAEYRFYRCRDKNTTCTFKHTLTELKLERTLIAILPELIQKELTSMELEATKQKEKPKYDLLALKEKLRRLNVTYMAGNKTDEEYVKEGAEIKKLIALAEQEVPPVERDVTKLKNVLDDEFVAVYSSFGPEKKQQFWRSIAAEIKLVDDRSPKIILKY